MRTLFLTLITPLFVLPAQAKYSGGTGEPNDPYQIATAADLIALGETPEDYDKHFILTADIDLDPNLPGRKVFDKAVIAPDTDITDEYSWYQGTAFSGVFDGNDLTISHLTIEGTYYLGLFGQLASGAEVKNLHIVDVNLTGSHAYVGGLVGMNSGVVTNCYSTGSVSGDGSVGGLMGGNGGRDEWWRKPGGIVTQCSAVGTVKGSIFVGGLIGGNYGTTS